MIDYVIENNNTCDISPFGDTIKVALYGESSYLVKWTLNGDVIGNMELSPGTWGAFPLSIGIWEIDFYKDGKHINSYRNGLNNKNVLLIFNSNEVGKTPDLDFIKEKVGEFDKYNCNVYVFFEGSYKVNLGNIRTLQLNQNIDFNLIYEYE